LVEQRIENPRVGGSIPPLATKHKKPAFAGFFVSGGLATIVNARSVPSVRSLTDFEIRLPLAGLFCLAVMVVDEKPGFDNVREYTSALERMDVRERRSAPGHDYLSSFRAQAPDLSQPN
jgi:hypothetical protein